MVDFTWTSAAGGDWSDAANWSPSIIGPPGKGDSATFNDLANNYTVTVKAGSTAGGLGTSLSIRATSALKDVAFDISGTLTADFLYGTKASGPATSLTIEAGGSLIVPTLLFSNDAFETVTISGTGAGGYLELGGQNAGGVVSGKSSMMILDFANTSPTTLNTGVIQIDNANSAGAIATQTITDVARGDAFVIKGANFTGDTAALAGNVLTVKDATDTTVFTMDDVSLQSGFTGGFDIVNGNTIEAACYARGTMILTDRGEVSIEELSIGDRVVTLFGEARPIRWIGRRAYDARFVAGNPALLPILIRQDALDDGVPRRDLYVSPKHALFLDDVLVPAEQLVNGVSIIRCETVATVEYFHIEVDTHDIILAEGAPSETFVDCDNRFMFQNADEFARLYPNYDTPTWAFCAPRVDEGDVLQHLRWRLDERLEVFGCTTTFDPDLHLVVDGVPVSADRVDDTVHVFRLQSPAREVRIVSRCSIPAELDVAFTDIRRLGVNVSRVVLSSDDFNIVVGCGDTSLVDGFHASEESHRWTDGDARIPAKFLACFDQDMIIEVHVLDHGLSYRTGQWEAERFAENAAAVPVGGRRTA